MHSSYNWDNEQWLISVQAHLWKKLANNFKWLSHQGCLSYSWLTMLIFRSGQLMKNSISKQVILVILSFRELSFRKICPQFHVVKWILRHGLVWLNGDNAITVVWAGCGTAGLLQVLLVWGHLTEIDRHQISSRSHSHFMTICVRDASKLLTTPKQTLPCPCLQTGNV